MTATQRFLNVPLATCVSECRFVRQDDRSTAMPWQTLLPERGFPASWTDWAALFSA